MIKKSSKPKVAIIILTWNGYQDTVECVRSVKKITYSNYELIVVDNGSTDGTEDKLRKEFPKLNILQTGENLGYTGGNNYGIEYALKKGFDYVFLLNNDTWVEKDFLDYLIDFTEEHKEVGAVGPMSCFTEDPKIIQTAGMRLKMMGMRINQVGGRQSKDKFEDPIFNLDAINGVAVLLKREVLEKVGLLDSDYFMYTDEIDWGYRIKKAGYTLAVVPVAKIYHKISMKGRRTDPKVLSYQTRGKFIFLRKHGRWYHYPPLFLSIFKLILVSFKKAGNLKKGFELAWSIKKGAFSGLTSQIKNQYD